MILLVTLTIDKFFTETCRSKSDGNLRRKKNAGISEKFCGKVLQKSFMGKFFGKVLQKVLRKSFKGKFFGKFYRKFYGEFFTEKVLRGKWGTRFGLRLGKLLIRHSSSEGHRFTSFSGFT